MNQQMTCRYCTGEVLPEGLCASCGRPALDEATVAMPAPVVADGPSGRDAVATSWQSDEAATAVESWPRDEVATAVESWRVEPGVADSREPAGGRTPAEEPRAAANPAEGPLQPGQMFGSRYRIIRLVGLGGMGAVYQAWDSELNLVVAVKVVRPEIAADPAAARDLERRFKRELLLARQVTHKNVVRIHDLGEIGGIKYITMPYIEGADLSTVLDGEGALSPRRALDIARSALAGLVAAHDAGVVHRDLKPANIMIDNGGEALIMDFGIARSSGPQPSAGRSVPAGRGVTQADPGRTVTGAIVGTLQYMAPEQSRGEEVDQRADVYAFGLILYDMLTGRRRMAETRTSFEEFQSRLQATPLGLHSVDPDIPEALDRVVTRCLQPDASARYQTSRELAAELDRLDQDGRRLPVVRRVGLPTVAAFSLLLALAGVAFWQASRTPPPAPAEREPVSVLVSDFDNRTGDPLFTSTLEQAVSVGIEGAPFVMSFSRRDAARLAEAMKPGSSLDASMARLVAVREGIAVVLAGRIEAGRDGGYSISARALDPADGRQLWMESTRVAGKNEVLAGIGRVVSQVREGLGDTTPAADRAASVESFTTTSLEALKDYTAAQELAAGGHYEEAIESYKRSLGHDPQLGRAHSGWATAAFYLGRKEEAEAHWKQALALMDRMSEREKYRTLGTYYLGIARNYEKAIENYKELVRLYPTDLAGHNNLAFAYFSVLDFSSALQEGLRARDLYPRNVVIGNNYALYAMYAGDFGAAASEAKRLAAEHPSFYKNYLPMAAAAVAAEDYAAAEDAYRQMAATGPQGASLARIGRADLAMYRGLYREAVPTLAEGAMEDAASGETSGQAMKIVAMAEALLETGQKAEALSALRRALDLSRQEPVLVPAARLLVRLGHRDDAAALAGELSRRLEVQSRAYSKILEADIAAAEGRLADAVDAYRASIALADFWLARLRLGVTYAEAGYYVEALAELEASARRRGEATAVFLDDTPSFRYLATLPYWLGRAQEGLGQSAAARASYEKFVTARAGAPDAALVGDARRRLGR